MMLSCCSVISRIKKRIWFLQKKYRHRIYHLMFLFGVDPIKTFNMLRGLPFYFQDLQTLKKQQKLSNISFRFGVSFPCLLDRHGESGSAKGHYFHQDLLVARRIYINRPNLHVDVGSRIDGFVAHVASFREIEVLDIRRLTSNIINIKFTQTDLMDNINDKLIEYCDSLSCLHALEHFGLGRYGDPIKYDGYLTGFKNLYKNLKTNGKFYFSVPMGPQRIEFNAHRIFSLKYLLELIEDKYRIDFLSYVDDMGILHENINLSDSDVQNNFGCHHGCVIFEMTKP